MSDPYLKRAFALEDIGDEIDLSLPPATGMDYLYRVRLETENCPEVVVANIDTTQFIARQTVQVDIYSGFIAARPGFKPDPEWQEAVLEEFRDSKLKISENRDMLKKKFQRRTVAKLNKPEEWCLYCLGAENQKKIYHDNTDESDVEKVSPKSKKTRLSSECQPPLLSVMIHLDQPKVKKLLNHFCHWLNHVAFSHQVGKWIYSLLICLEKPLDPNTCSLLRNLSRHCCRFRDNLTNPADDLVKPLNVLITVIAHHFDQKDLCDSFNNN